MREPRQLSVFRAACPCPRGGFQDGWAPHPDPATPAIHPLVACDCPAAAVSTTRVSTAAGGRTTDKRRLTAVDGGVERTAGRFGVPPTRKVAPFGRRARRPTFTKRAWGWGRRQAPRSPGAQAEAGATPSGLFVVKTRMDKKDTSRGKTAKRFCARGKNQSRRKNYYAKGNGTSDQRERELRPSARPSRQGRKGREEPRQKPKPLPPEDKGRVDKREGGGQAPKTARRRRQSPQKSSCNEKMWCAAAPAGGGDAADRGGVPPRPHPHPVQCGAPQPPPSVGASERAKRRTTPRRRGSPPAAALAAGA